MAKEIRITRFECEIAVMEMEETLGFDVACRAGFMQYDNELNIT